ncbi:MAG: efflux RND transporter periplasmic adaptor subunit [Minisyncoccales bacterium]
MKLDDIVDNYFTTNDQISLKVRDKQQAAEVAIEDSEQLIESAEDSKERETIEEAILKLEDGLEKTKEVLKYTRDEAVESSLYKNDVSSTEKTTLEDQKSNVETALSNITTARQNIESQKISTRKNINSAKAKVTTAEDNLESAKTESEQKITQAESKVEELEDQLEIQESALENAQSNLKQAEKKLNDASIEAPISGIITEVNIETGESAKPDQVVVEIIPEEKYKIETDVPEVDMAELKEGDKVNVDFDAFQNEEFKGEVTKIYPSEIVKEGVIYYRTEVELNKYPEKIKSGLTANLEIITNSKENALVVPYVAVKEDDKGKYIQIIEDGQIKGEKRRVETGLEGETMIEIKKGLKEGDQVATYIEEE